MVKRRPLVETPNTPVTSEYPGVNLLANSPLDGPNENSATNFEVLAADSGNVTFVTADATDHRAVRFANPSGGSGRARVGQNVQIEAGKTYTLSATCTSVEDVGDTSADNVVLNWFPFTAVNPLGPRPTTSELVPGERISVTFEALETRSLGLRLGLSLEGTATLEGLMFDESADLRGYTPSEVAEAAPTFEVGLGNAIIADGMMPRILNRNNKTVAMAFVIPRDGVLTSIGFECASNNPDDINPDGTPIGRTKSMGPGDYTLDLKLTAAQPGISGDGFSRILAPTGALGVEDFIIRPDFSTVYRTGSVTHDRANNLGAGDRRHWHIWQLSSPLNVMAGQKLALVGYAKSSGASSDYISFTNPPTMSPKSAKRMCGPYLDDPARNFSPREGFTSFAMLLSESTNTSVDANRRYKREPQHGQLGLYYSNGFSYGQSARECNGLTSQLRIGGSTRARERFRHLGEPLSCRYVWIPCFWPTKGGRPTSPLVVQLVEETTSTTWSGSANAAPSGTNTFTTVRNYNGGRHTADSFADYVRIDLGAARSIVPGRDYRLELSSNDGSRRYSCFGFRHAVTAHDTIDPPGAPITGLTPRVGQNNPAVLSFAQRSTNGGSSWTGLTLYTSNRPDVSLSFWLQPEA